MNRRCSLLARALPAALLIPLATGCAVSSGRATYTAHTGHSVSAGGQPSANVAMAFGLDGQRTATGTIAHVDPR